MPILAGRGHNQLTIMQQSQVKSDQRWNEDHFHADNVEDTQHGVRPADTLNPNVFNDAAPSRPPSRVSARGTTATDGQDDI